MSQLFKNNARSTLAASLATGALSLTVATGEGALFPTLAGADYFLATIESGTDIEIIKVTARSTDSFTIEREQEGTTSPASFASGSVISLRLTAAVLETTVNHVADTADAHAASAITNTPAGNLAAVTVQAALDELQTELDAATAHITDATDAHAASAISYAGNTNLVATNVEAALDELDNEKQPIDPLLTALAAQVTAANKVQAYSGADTATLLDFKDEDDMVSDSATAVPSQTVKAFGGTLAPAGAVMHFAMSTAPTGWLKANGAAVSRTTYAALFTAIGTTFGVGDGSTTFNLPDLRGEFVRGFDDGKGTDSGRVFGSAQDDAMQGHYHSALSGSFQVTAGGISYGSATTGSSTAATTGSPASDGTNGTPRTAAETRPRNIALLACIKY